MLQHLVGVDEIERAVVGFERVDIARRELHVGDALGSRVASRRLDHVRRRVEAEHGPRRDEAREVERDGAGPTAHVEYTKSGTQVREQVGGRILGGAPAVRTQHALVVPVGVRGSVAF